MQNKRTFFITLGALILACIIMVIVILLVSNRQRNIVDVPVSFPSYVVKPNVEDLKKYKFAIITPADQIELRKETGEELIINLDKKEWIDIKWNPDYEIVSVLGKTQNGIYNLFIYDFRVQEWVQVTDYDSDNVDSYAWLNSDVILFTQGKDSNRWLHRYSYSAQNEILKLEQVAGSIYKISPNSSSVILANPDKTYSLSNIQGKTIALLNEITEKIEESDGSLINIRDVFYSKSSTSLILRDAGRNLFLNTIGESDAERIDNSESRTFVPICSTADQILRGFKIKNSTDLEILDMNISTNQNNSVSIKYFKYPVEVDSSNTTCLEDTVMFKLKVRDEQFWYQYKGEIFERIPALDESKDTAYKL